MAHRRACIIDGRDIHYAGTSAAIAAAKDRTYNRSAAQTAPCRRSRAVHDGLYSQSLEKHEPFDVLDMLAGMVGAPSAITSVGCAISPRAYWVGF
mmetsp:Transcript_21544/g.64719  ORF Transcript_21544/g.64719 Transcript_21544/m.64719 type:complete len:95 (+) Transcript_21544:282-566(+)